MRISDWSSDVCSSDLPAPGREDAFRKWYNDEYLPGAVARPGVKSGGLLVFRTYGQMIPTTPSHKYVGIYRINDARSEEHTSELQSLMRISYAVFCLKKKQQNNKPIIIENTHTIHQ